MTMTCRRILATLLVALALCLATGCADPQLVPQSPEPRVLDARTDTDNPATYKGLPLRTGQIIISESPGAYSFFFSLVPSRYCYFTHAATIVMEDGKPFVYDIAGDYKPTFADRPTDAIKGTVRRIPFWDYCQPNLYAEIYDPLPTIDTKKLVAFIHDHYKRETPFDPYFRFDEHEALYCSEFVYLAQVAAGAKAVEFVPAKQNPSLQRVLTWLGVPTDEALPAFLFVEQDREARYRGAVGLLASRTTAICYFEAKREIHRRFTDDQRLGTVFTLDGYTIGLRPDIEHFLLEAVRLYPTPKLEPTEEQVRARVHKLAARLFGFF